VSYAVNVSAVCFNTTIAKSRKPFSSCARLHYWTQERLAEIVGLNIRNIQKIEAGETNVLITTAIRIRKALGCSAEKLISRE
jgi:DNA-binding XRE family transcriptional regulator